MSNTLSKKDILLVFIDLPVDDAPKLVSPIQIMKAMFLLKEETKIQDFYEFIPYLYGPCSFEVYSDLISLKEENLIEDVQSPFSWKYYKVTAKGNEVTNRLLKSFDNTLLQKLKEIKMFVLSKTFPELLRYVYEKYPAYAEKTVINLGALK
jgi:DNA-binding PadR family transcriptional regulator